MALAQILELFSRLESAIRVGSKETGCKQQPASKPLTCAMKEPADLRAFLCLSLSLPLSLALHPPTKSRGLRSRLLYPSIFFHSDCEKRTKQRADAARRNLFDWASKVCSVSAHRSRGCIASASSLAIQSSGHWRKAGVVSQ